MNRKDAAPPLTNVGIGAPQPGPGPDADAEIHTTDSEAEDSDTQEYSGPQIVLNSGIKPVIKRRYTKEDADSLIGGQQISFGEDELEASAQLSAPLHAGKAHEDEPGHDFFGQKVFQFSLPFGGLSSIRSNLKLPSFLHKDEEDPEIQNIRLRLERQQSLNTIDEARAFSSKKGTDDVRFRAMKQSLKENISEFLPEFIVKNKKPYDTVFSEISGPIVVLGGYRGSILRETDTGRRAWVPLKAGLNLRKIRLLLGPNPEDELNASRTIYADGVLKNVGPFDICKRFLKKLDNGKTSVIEFGYDWRLSLEISSNELIDKLAKIKKDHGQNAIVVAHSMGGLVAHGAMQKRPELFRGIVYAGSPSECFNILGPIRYGDSVMFSDRILTFETNFMMRSSFSFLPLGGAVFANEETGETYDLDYFDPETWVEYNLNPLVSSTRRAHEKNEHDLPAGMNLSPTFGSNSRSNSGDFSQESRQNSGIKSIDTLVAEHHPTEDVSSSLLSPMGSISSRIKQIQTGINRKGKVTVLTNQQMIKRSKSGRMSPASPVEEMMEESFSLSFTDAYNYLKDTLAKTKKFLLGLDYDEKLEQKYPPLAVVYGDKVPSVRGSYVRNRQDIKDGNYYHFFYGRGDGVVHQKWLMPENKGFERYDPKTGKGQIVGKFASGNGHVNLMGDFEAMGAALGAILEAEKTWKK